jgi:heptosyltransferase-2
MKRILIIQTAFIGDVILITPLIRSTKELYPDANIDVLVVPAAAGLLENNPHINRVLSYPKRKSPLKSMKHIVQSLKQQAYDIAISPHSSGRTHLILYLARIPIRIGFDRGTAARLLSLKIPHPRGMHKSAKNLQLLKLISDKDFSQQTELFPSEKDFAKIESLRTKVKGQVLIAIAPGSVWATKCWPIDYYKRLAQMLAQQGYALVLTGGGEDKEKCDEIEACLDSDKVLNLAGLTSLLESAAAIKACRAMICNDSGALHIANAMQVKVFAFFGPTVQRIGYFPFRAGDHVFEVDLPCRPCSSHGPQQCPLKHHNCMKLLEPETALQTIMAQMGDL